MATRWRSCEPSVSTSERQKAGHLPKIETPPLARASVVRNQVESRER